MCVHRNKRIGIKYNATEGEPNRTVVERKGNPVTWGLLTGSREEIDERAKDKG